MRKFLAIIVCKLAAFVGKLIGKGSSKPGALALKICPHIISRLELPKTIVAVTGSNGKTSTVELAVKILRESGMNICWNKEGSNQTEGIATMLICNATLGGKVTADAVVMESDERYARLTFKFLKPTHFMILNILRDQMTRNGHPEFICGKIADAVSPDMKIILNADDPMSVLAAKGAELIGFGVEKNALSSEGKLGVYDDGVYCPACGGEFEYSYRVSGEMGDYYCKACGMSRFAPKYSLTAFDEENGIITVSDGEEHSMKCGINSLYHAYNMLAAFALCRELGVSAEQIEKSISDYFLTNGRVRCWEHQGRKLVLLTSKHENSTSYDYSLEYAARAGGSVLVIVDAVSRKYFTGETSWLWDIDFNRLSSESVDMVYIAGKYVWDIAQRLDYTDISKDKIVVLEELDEIKEMLGEDKNDIYIVTCFSDRDKFISRIPENAVERKGL
ncbi:MAG: DUF1727 domain-containing protein [Clostridia bacterium]|nr:DUF1727 domain-containing protein [Clostridia bacterium]